MRSWMSTRCTVGTICSSGWLAEPSTCSCSTPLTYAGRSSCALVPSALTCVGFSRNISTPPTWFTHFSSTSVPSVSPAPSSLTVWPAFALATAASAGVPDSATACTPARLTV
jgi:hypothetical protein